MGLDLYLVSIKEKEKKGELEVARGSKVQKWLLQKAKKGECGVCYAQNELKMKDLEQLLSEFIIGKFNYSQHDERFHYDLSMEIMFNHPKVAKALADGKMSVEEIPVEIIEDYIKKRNYFETQEVQRVIDFLKLAFDRGLRVIVGANW